MNAKEEAMEKYNDMMSKALLNLMSEVELNNMEAKYRRKTIESFEEMAKKYSHLVKKHTDNLNAVRHKILFSLYFFISLKIF